MRNDDFLARRLESLERSNRRLKLAVAGCAMGLFALVLVAAERQTPVVSAESFRLVDAEGKLRAAWGSDREGTFFFLNDPEGKMRTSFAAQKDQTYINFKDEKGETRAVVSFDENGPSLRLRDAKGTTTTAVATDQNGAMLHLSDGQGLSRVITPLSDVLNDENRAKQRAE